MKLNSLDDTELLNLVTPLAAHTENAWNNKNYQDFCIHLSQDAVDIISEDDFNNQLVENFDKYGSHSISEIVAIHRNPENVIVLWKVNFEKRKEPGLLMYRFIESEGNLEIQGCTYQA
jgi:hypothetical protein